MKKVAIFDIDGTLFRSSLLVELVKELVNEGVFPKKAKLEYDRAEEKWLNRKGSYADYLRTLIRSYMKHLKGVKYADVHRVSEKVVEIHKDRVYRHTRDLIKDLKKKKYYLVAISQSPKVILDMFCQRMGFDKVYGRLYETGPQGKFTGKVVDLHLIANKANVVRRVIKKEGLTLKDSLAVGDSEGDIPMLELVDHPICFNPNSKLYKHAKRTGWKVVVERKDVVFEI
jgi:HAD superfamily hydrolase (TIGR01490 family)